MFQRVPYYVLLSPFIQNTTYLSTLFSYECCKTLLLYIGLELQAHMYNIRTLVLVVPNRAASFGIVTEDH